MIAADRLAGSGQGTSSRIIRTTRSSGPSLFLPSSSFHTFKLLSPYPTVLVSNAPSPAVLFSNALSPPYSFSVPPLWPCPYSQCPSSPKCPNSTYHLYLPFSVHTYCTLSLSIPSVPCILFLFPFSFPFHSSSGC